MGQRVTTPAPTILIVASEPSGDRLAAPIVTALRARYPQARLVGVGGPEMTAAGLELLFPYDDLAVMGLLEVLPRLPRIRARLQQLVGWVAQHRPSLVLTVDGSTFSATLRRRIGGLGQANFHVPPCVHYVVPKVWAWRPGRVKKLAPYLTHLLAELPLGIQLFQNAGVPTTYVGHAGIQELLNQPPPATTRLQLALLPGSRTSELRRHWPVMLATYRRLRQLHPQLTAALVLPTPEYEPKTRAIASWDAADAITLVTGPTRFTQLSGCAAALAKSGTITLELACLRIPTVVMYIMSPLTYALARLLVTVKWVSLPNILLGSCLSPEFLQRAATPPNLARALHAMLQHGPTERMRQQWQQLHTLLHVAQPPAQGVVNVISTLVEPAKQA